MGRRYVVSCLFLFSLLFSSSVSADKNSWEREKPWLEEGWLRLLHYKKIFGGKFKSQADGLGFFVSANGKFFPESEFVGLVSHLRESQTKNFEGSDDSIVCRFPARIQWIVDRIDEFNNYKLPKCPNFEKYLERTRAKSISLVFSSYYLNNPSSALGHTLLRLNKKNLYEEGEHLELLDNGVNFAAIPTTQNPLAYAFLGIFGGFTGQHALMPYYYKVREYNDFESRDLWSYDLNLIQEEVDQVVRHIWELGSTHFDYWYLDENCAYHTLSILDGAIPRLSLVEKLPSIVLPVDAIRVINSYEDLVRNVHYRPSIRMQFESRYSALTPQEKAETKRVLEAPKKNLPLSADLSPASQAKILDTVIDGFDVRHAKELINPQSLLQNEKLFILNYRSKIPINSPDLMIQPDKEDFPHMGHDNSRIFIGGKYLEKDNFSEMQIGFRHSLQALEDRSVGYPKGAEIAFFSIEAAGNLNAANWQIKKVDLFEVKSLVPFEGQAKNLSWRVRVGSQGFSSLPCQGCYGSINEVGGGASVQVSKNPFLLIYGLGVASLVIAKSEKQYFHPAILPESGALLLYNGWLSFHTNLKNIFYFLNKKYVWEFKPDLRIHLARNYSVGFFAELKSNHSAIMGANFYAHF